MLGKGDAVEDRTDERPIRPEEARGSASMTIQIEQKFPRCQRCGKMIHFRAEHLQGVDRDGKKVVLCSEICAREYADLINRSDQAHTGAVSDEHGKD
jgi:hypothetical protein